MGAGELDGGKGAEFDLGRVVILKLLGGAKRFDFDTDVFAERDEIEIDTGGAIDGFKDLLLEKQARHVAIDVGNADVTGVDFAEAAQQGLGEGEGSAGARERVGLAV